MTSAGRAIIAMILAFAFAIPLLASGARAQDDPVALMKKAVEFTRQGKFDDAIAMQKRVTAAVEKMAGKRHPLYLAQIALLGEIHTMKQDYAEAERLHLEALRLREQALGATHVDVAASLAKLADIYITTARYDKAEANLARVAAIREKALPQTDPDYGLTYLSLGRLHALRSRHGDAEREFRRALAIFEKNLKPDHGYLPLARTNLAETVRALGRGAEAERLLRQALAENERINGPDSFLLAANVNNLSELFREQGRFGEAEQYGRRAVALVEKSLGPDHPSIAISLNNLSLFLMERGRAEEAVTLMRRALAIQRKTFGAEHPNVATALHNLGEALARTGKHAEAEALYREGLAMRERIGGPKAPPVASSVHSISVFLHDRKRHGEAEQAARRAVAIRKEAFGPDHPLTALSIANLAVMIDEQNRHEEAQPLYEQAVSVMERSVGRDHPSYAAALGNLASNFADMGQWRTAHDKYREAGRVWVERRDAATADASAPAGDADGELRQNTASFLGAVRTGHELWRAAPEPEKAALMEEAFAAHQWALVTSAASALTKMSARVAAGAGPLADLVREQQDLTAELAALDRTLVAAMSGPAAGRDVKGEEELRRRAEAARVRLGGLTAQLSTRFPDFAALASPAPVSLAALREALKPGETLYTLAMTRHGTYAWAVTAETERWVRIDRTAAQIEEDVRALRCGLDVAAWDGEGPCARLTGRGFDPASGAPPPFDVARASALYRALFGQMEDLVRGRRLIVVPSGALTQLPFHVLVSGDGPPATSDGEDYRATPWLARDTTIAVLPAVSSLVALRVRAGASAAANPYLAFGNPLLEGPDSRYAPLARRARASQRCAAPTAQPVHIAGLASRAGRVTTTAGLADIAFLRIQAPLPETAEELCAVAGVMKADADSVRLGGAATETAIKRMNEGRGLARYRVLHFATHGTMAGEGIGVSEPGLLFTPPAKASADDDGYLSAAEIGALQLDADLVILSACNTAAGGAGDADALAGLARSFFHAGARSLFVSHWAVFSDATVRLITTALGEAGGPAKAGYPEALRAAMLELIDGRAGGGAAASYAHPAYWAPFVVVGL